MKRSAILSLSFLLLADAVGAQQTVPVPPIPGPGNLPATGSAPSRSAPAPAPPASPSVPPTAPAPVASGKVVASPLVPSTYTVQSGDNLWNIARKHGVRLEDLLKANKIKNPENLKIGEILNLPPGASAEPDANSAPVKPTPVPAAAASSGAPAVPAGGDWEFYTVQKGDNPWKIAKTLKVEHRKILSLNEGVDFTRLKIGQQIRVPRKP